MFQILHRFALVIGLLAGTCMTAAGSPREKLQSTIDAALDVIYSDCCKEMSDQEKQAEVRKTVESNYDLNVIIRRAIGRNWELMSEAEQTRVVSLVKELVLKAYVKGLKGKIRPQITLGEVTQISSKRMEIESTVVLDNQTYNVLYRLGNMPSGWQIYDIVAENVSVVSNYREQIDDHFRKGNGAELIDRLEELLAKNNTDEDIQI